MVNRVREFRVKTGMKQEELASLCDIGRSTLSEIENNHHIPGVDVALRISKMLGQQVEKLWILEEEK